MNFVCAVAYGDFFSESVNTGGWYRLGLMTQVVDEVDGNVALTTVLRMEDGSTPGVVYPSMDG